MVCLMLNKAEEAIFAYQRVLDLKPHDNNALFNFANALFIKKIMQLPCLSLNNCRFNFLKIIK